MTKNPYMPKLYTVIEHKKQSPTNFSIKVDMKADHDPGQFVQVSVPGFGEAPISICSDSRQYIMLNIRIAGVVTHALAKLRRGDKVLLRGPYGKGYPKKEFKNKNIILIGGGCGVAPLRGLIEYLHNNHADHGEIMLFMGYRTPNDILFKTDIKKWKKRFAIKHSVDNVPGKSCYSGYVGYVTQLLEEESIKTKNTAAALCGPPGMMNACIGILKNKGLDDNQIYISQERLMYCGIGLCCHCMIRDKFTCKDGPVFRYDQIKYHKND